MHKIHLYLALILCSLRLHASQLTVVVAVDGLDAYSLNELQAYWPQGGLRTLSEEAIQTTVTFPHLLYGGSEALATYLTGVMPAEHGVCMDAYFSRDDRQVHPLLVSSDKLGIGTKTSYSAQALLTPTITDKQRIRNADTRVYAIGIHPEATMLLAGHAANACCWIGSNQDSLRWVSTAYYKEGLPDVAERMNASGRFAQIAQREWTPVMGISAYMHPTAAEKSKSFKYQGARYLPSSPMANALVAELAVQLQKNKQLGEGYHHDYLMLEMTVVSPLTQQDQIASAEQEDMYLSLNKDLGYIKEQIEKRVGKDELKIVVLGLPKHGIGIDHLEALNMPTKFFNLDRSVALTSTYLMALYGRERWIDGGYGQSIYLNRKLIEQKHLSFETICQQVADFLMQFEGVQTAMPAAHCQTNPILHNSLSRTFMGDVVYLLQTNYRLTANQIIQGKEREETLDYIQDYVQPSPVWIWCGGPMPAQALPQDATQVDKWIE